MSRLAQALKGLAGKLRREKPPAMIGLPPSTRGLTGRPADPASHTQEVAHEWEDVGAAYVQKTMRELGIAEHRIGAPNYERGGVKRAFLPEDTRGGTNDEWGRLYVDSGILNRELTAAENGPEAARIWAESRLRDRVKAVVAHEDIESRGVSHDEAVQLAPDTELPIGENARRILRSIAEGANRER